MSENQRLPGRGSPPGLPRWVKLFVMIFIFLVLLVVILHLMGFGLGGHGVSDARGLLPGSPVDYELSMAQAQVQLRT